MFREGNYKWEDHFVPYAEYKGTAGGLAISISACDDHQNSQDTTVCSLTSLSYYFEKRSSGCVLVVCIASLLI